MLTDITVWMQAPDASLPSAADERAEVALSEAEDEAVAESQDQGPAPAGATLNPDEES